MDPFSADAPMLRALHKVTGYSSFRPTQREAIDAVLQGKTVALAGSLIHTCWETGWKEHPCQLITQLCAGRDVLLVLATGGGKSACFQVWSQ